MFCEENECEKEAFFWYDKYTPHNNEYKYFLETVDEYFKDWKEEILDRYGKVDVEYNNVLVCEFSSYHEGDLYLIQDKFIEKYNLKRLASKEAKNPKGDNEDMEINMCIPCFHKFTSDETMMKQIFNHDNDYYEIEYEYHIEPCEEALDKKPKSYEDYLDICDTIPGCESGSNKSRRSGP
jgi:hypothetical protein